MVRGTLTIALTVALMLVTGCVKKPKEVKAVPQPKHDTVVVHKKDSSDVFKEFYKDTAVASDASAKTFSLNAPESYIPEFSKNGRYVVQVSSQTSRTLASELTTELKEKGYPAYMVEIQNPSSDKQGTYFRTRVGGFATRSDAKAFGENILKPMKLDYWVDLKSNEGTPAEPSFNGGGASSSFTSGSSSYSSSSANSWSAPTPLSPAPSVSPAPTPASPSPISSGSSSSMSTPAPAPLPDITPSPPPVKNARPLGSGGWHDTASVW
jgi:hypothetical protein